MRGIIYKITNIKNKKVYIGQTIDFKSRIRNHKYRGIKNKKTQYISNVINKYGWDSFEVEILEICDEQNLTKREIYWVEYYNSLDKQFGYNIKIPGPHGPHSKETKEKISKNNKGKHGKVTLMHKKELKSIRRRSYLKIRNKKILNENMLEVTRDREYELLNGEPLTQEEIKQYLSKKFKNRKVSKITRERLSKAAKKQNRDKFKVIILEFNLDGKFIKEWESIKEASIKLKLQSSKICEVCRGNRKSTGGKVFRYKDPQNKENNNEI